MTLPYCARGCLGCGALSLTLLHRAACLTLSLVPAQILILRCPHAWYDTFVTYSVTASSISVMLKAMASSSHIVSPHMIMQFPYIRRISRCSAVVRSSTILKDCSGRVCSCWETFEGISTIRLRGLGAGYRGDKW